MFDENYSLMKSILPTGGANAGVLAPAYQQQGMDVFGFLDSLKTPRNAPGTGVLKLGGDTPPGVGGGLNFSDKLGLGIDTVNSILGAVNGHRAYSLGKRQLTAQIDQFNRQFEAQRGLINSQLADRQDWRNRNQPGKFASTAEYMDKYGVK